ncbi:MAG: insulinase family protein [Deltaproteobacteria bacterium]|nr:insulinase family protein [Deltaproteobacteria bacterium]
MPLTPLRPTSALLLGLSLALSPALGAGCAARRGGSVTSVMDGDQREPRDMQALVNQLAASPPETPMPFDPGVLAGQLDNGVRYFIEPNAVPPRRAELRLVVDAGSVLEDEDQRGVAHFVEHMAFNGTRRFPGTELVRWLESNGAAFGSHINAQTGFDTTTYLLRVPTGDPASLETAVDVLRDWVDGVSFDPAEFEKERGVVLEEWRTGRGADSRSREKVLPLLLHESRYAVRDPIGSEASIKGLSVEAAKRFYADWYRADNIAVIAVGDFDPVAMQASIVGAFGDLPKPAGARERVRYPVPDHQNTLVAVIPDPETTHSVVAVQLKVDDKEEDTLRHYRDSVLISNLAFLMLNERLGVRGQEADPPWFGAGMQPERLTATRGLVGLGAVVPEAGVERGLEQLLVELERARRHGFTEEELQRAKLYFARNMDQYYKERHSTDSGTHASELERHVTTGEPVPGIPYEFALAAALLPQVSAPEVKEWLVDALPDHSRVIVATVPEKAGTAPPTEAQLLAVVERVKGMQIAPPVQEAAEQPLMVSLPTPGSIVSEREIPELGVTAWTLSNGLELWLRPTGYKADQVLFSLEAPAGSTATDPADWVSVMMATEVVERSGLGALDPIALGRTLAGKDLSLSPYIGEQRTGLVGGSAADIEDIEALLQLVHLHATAPRFSPEGVAAAQRQRAANLSNRLASPEGKLNDAWNRMIWPDEPRTRPWTEATVQGLDPAKAEAAWRQLFGALGQGKAVMVGRFDPAEVKPLVERYLATLPAVPALKNSHPMPPPRSGAREEVLRAGSEPTATVQVRLDGQWGGAPEERHLLSGVATALELVLREDLREQLGGTYGVGVDLSVDEQPEARWALTFGFQCDPARAAQLKDALLASLARIQSTGLPADVVERVAAGQRSDQELVRTSNLWWRDALRGAQRKGGDPALVKMMQQAASWTTKEALDRTAAKALATPDRAVLTLVPATTTP